jgi:signal transduction histidine kinase
MDDLPADSGLMGWIFERRESVVVSNLKTDPRVSDVAWVKGFRAWISTPMRAEGRVVGVFSVFDEAERQFSAEDVALLTTVADHVGVAVQNARMRQMAERAAALDERERLARELHDAVTQSLFSLTLFTEAARERMMSGETDQVLKFLDEIGTTGHRALREMRLMLYELRPPALEEEGLVGALRRRLEAVEARVGVKGRVLTDTLIELPSPVEEGLYRIVQEALNNALRHADTPAVTVHISLEGEQVLMEVFDEGQGFDLNRASGGGGMGLVTMRERAESLGGTFAISSQPGRGTNVQVRVRATLSDEGSLEES